ncbi:hypothetical protein GCM10023219_11200 [Stakelama sediminis]|uniref:DNA-binding CsgD family transcriptional regulator n=1 Tax=Stakelama sediminis TaxID=463200 RepID=A0A840YWB8_9SPHN|nr:hypothetical protein [Stakelama sediminis]MBB5717844.1 DNA-binding CsgD family transcriptional regulator [Stakelama sediminis]
MLTIRDEDELLTAVHDGLFERPLWGGFLEQLRLRVRATGATLLLRLSEEPGDVLIGQATGLSPAVLIDLLPPRRSGETASLPALREGRVYALAELVDFLVPGKSASELEKSGIPGLRDLRIVRITEAEGSQALLAVAHDSHPLSAADGAILGRMATHFRRALRNYAAMTRLDRRNGIAEDLLNRTDLCWFRLDHQGRVLDHSAGADAALMPNMAVQISRDGRLRLASAKTDTALREGLNTVSAGRQSAVPVDMGQGVLPDMLLIRPKEADDSDTVIAYIRTGSVTHDRSTQLAQRFGLLPSEARLAMELATGATIAQAAETLSLTIETARNYSKKIYAKTGVSGQAQLVHAILNSTAWLS